MSSLSESLGFQIGIRMSLLLWYESEWHMWLAASSDPVLSPAVMSDRRYS